VTTSTSLASAISRAASAPAEAAELQATIRSFAPRPSSSSVFATTRSLSSSELYVPYGKWALSQR
jgi:hypothetical protein